MKKTTLPTDKPSSTTTTEQGADATVSKVKPKKAVKATKELPAKQTIAEPTIVAVASAETVKKSPIKKAPVKALEADKNAALDQQVAATTQTAKPKTVSAVKQPTKPSKPLAAKPSIEATDLLIAERVGLTAGNIWHYLSQHGITPVSKLLKVLTEEEIIIQRSIGWLAHEGKIEFINRAKIESIRLKD